MLYIVDAFNLIFQVPDLEETLETEGFPAVRAALVKLLSEVVRVRRNGEIVAVFDGSEKGAHRPRQEWAEGGRIRLLFSEPGQLADQRILDLVEAAPRPGEITVVTNDKHIARNAKGFQARHLSCRAFLRSASRRRTVEDGEDPRKYRGLSDRETEEWLRYFGFTDSD